MCNSVYLLTPIVNSKISVLTIDPFSYENHTRNFQAFIEALESGGDFLISGPEARKAVEVILAIYKSAKEKKPVKLNA
jgi:predicted dehydrogenase